MDHTARRRDMLRKHPELRELMGHDWRSKHLALACACAHVWIATRASTLQSTLGYLATLYACGATLAQAGFLAVHELSHNLFFSFGPANRAFSILVNLPLVFPFAIAFREYHMLHHAHQGDPERDLDLPSGVEVRRFRGRFGKLCWLTFQIVFYALRPCLKRPISPSPLLIANLTAQLAFDAIVVAFLGWGVLRFLALSVFLAGGLHPCAGHFLSEHFLFDDDVVADGQDTFAYYGPLNLLTWNVGHHVEHHDFPTIPGSRLPKVRRVAPSFYSNLRSCPSWTCALYKFVSCDNMTLQKRRRV